MFNGPYYIYNPSPYNHNMYRQQNFIENNNMNQMRYNKDFSHNPIEITPVHKKSKTSDFKKFDSNKLQRDFKNYENLLYQHNNKNINYNNRDHMKWNNLNKNQMNETNNKVLCDFNFKRIEDTKNQIPAQRKNKLSNFDRDLLKLFIYIYYYEKIEKNIFHNSENDI